MTEVKDVESKRPVEYANAKIYKMFRGSGTDIYVGSTTATLESRLHSHKNAALLHPERKVYKEIGDMGNVQIALIEDFPCRTKRELLRRERYWYDQLKPTLNSCKPVLTWKETRDNLLKWRNFRARRFPKGTNL
jgi:hypothetical protein